MWHPIKHFITITRHRHKVIKYCFKCGIGLQGLKHDLSKYSWTEFKIGMKYYTGVKSPNSQEIKLKGYSTAWLHHCGRNKHHFEYWLFHKSGDEGITAAKMPLKYVKEMFCDRIAATKIYEKKNYTSQKVLDYYMKSNDCYMIHKDTNKLLVEWLTLLVNIGEKETFKKIKHTKNY